MSNDPVLDLGELGEPAITDTAIPDTAKAPRRRRLRSLCEPGLLVLGAAAALLAAELFAGGDAPSATGPSATRSNGVAAHEGLTLLAPSTARPGQALTVVAYRHRETCGSTVLTFDGGPVSQRSVLHANGPGPDWSTMMITFTVPPDAASGSHEVALNGADGHCDQSPAPLVEVVSRPISVSRTA